MRRKEEGIQAQENTRCLMHEAWPEPWRKSSSEGTHLTGKYLTTLLLKTVCVT